MSATRREEILHAQGLLLTLFRACKGNAQASSALHSLQGTCRVLLLLQPCWVRAAAPQSTAGTVTFPGKSPSTRQLPWVPAPCSYRCAKLGE